MLYSTKISHIYSMFSLEQKTSPPQHQFPFGKPPEPPPTPKPPDIHEQQHSHNLHQTSNPDIPPSSKHTPQEDLQGKRSCSDSSDPKSYKDKLIKESRHIYFPTWFEYVEAEKCEEEEEESQEIETSIPNISFSEQELTRLRTPWRKSLIIHTINCKRSIPDIKFRLQKIWKTKGNLDIIDMGQGFYIAKFTNPEEYFLALAGGPWFMFQFHLAVHQWQPNFRKKLINQEKMFIWAQFRDLPVEYFNEEALFRLATAIGRPIKMDINTSEITRGKFARVCIEVSTMKPLPPYVRINKFKQEIAYELNSGFCNGCGKIGHLFNQCKENEKVKEQTSSTQTTNSTAKNQWNIINKRRPRNPRKSGNTGKNENEKRDSAKERAETPEPRIGEIVQRKTSMQWKPKQGKMEKSNLEVKNKFEVLHQDVPEKGNIAGASTQSDTTKSAERAPFQQETTKFADHRKNQSFGDDSKNTWLDMEIENVDPAQQLNIEVNNYTQGAALAHFPAKHALASPTTRGKFLENNIICMPRINLLTKGKKDEEDEESIDFIEKNDIGKEDSTVTSTFSANPIFKTHNPTKPTLKPENYNSNLKISLYHGNSTTRNNNVPNEPTPPTNTNTNGGNTNERPNPSTTPTTEHYQNPTTPSHYSNSPRKKQATNPTPTTTEWVLDPSRKGVSSPCNPDSTHPPDFEPTFVFTAKPEEPGPTTAKQPSKPWVPFPTTTKLSTTKPADSIDTDNLHLPGLPYGPTPFHRAPFNSENHRRGGPRTGRDTHGERVSIPSENDPPAPSKRPHPKSEFIHIPKRRCDSGSQPDSWNNYTPQPTDPNPNANPSQEL